MEQPERILIIDDDPMARMLARETLTHEGYEIDEAENGEAGLLRLQQERPLLVLLDILMPGLDGYEVCRRIRAEAGLIDLPIVMMTGLDDDNSVRLAFDAGATDFIGKPLQPTLLIQRLRYLLRARRAYETSRINEQLLRASQRVARLGSWQLSPDLRKIILSPEILEEFGGVQGHYTKRDGILEVSIRDFLYWIHAEDRGAARELLNESMRQVLPMHIECRLQLPGEDLRWVRIVGKPGQTPSEPVYLGIVQDVTELYQNRSQILSLAYYDSVTQLPNRSFMNEYIPRLIRQCQRSDKKLAVICLAVKNIHKINDSLGKQGGDAVLKCLSERLAKGVRATDLVACDRSPLEVTPHSAVLRVEGNEFVIVLYDIADHSAVSDILHRLVDELTADIDYRGSHLSVKLAAGVAIYPDDGNDLADLTHHASLTLHQAKLQNGKFSFHFFHQQMARDAKERLRLEQDLTQALSRGELQLAYQPQVACDGVTVHGVEALLRWRHPQLGWVSPVDVIPVAEESGLINQLGDWVLEQACKQLALWREQGMELSVSVNLSSVQLQQVHVVLQEKILSTLERHQLPPCCLILELTEGVLIQNMAECMDLFQDLRKRGIRIAIDDFGTGYASLSYLTRLPIDEIKIDRSFITEVTHDARSQKILCSIVDLAHGLNLRLVAEGVEDQSQLEYIVAQQCDDIQGFFYSKPLFADDFQAWFSTFCMQSRERPAGRG